MGLSKKNAIPNCTLSDSLIFFVIQSILKTTSQPLFKQTSLYKIRRSGLFFLFLLFSHSLFAQGIKDSVFQINPITVTSKRLFKKEAAGMKETRVDSMVMREKMSLSLSELLSQNTSIFIKSNGRGALATASFRGTAPSHTQVSWNGININSPMLGMVDFSLIPVYIIDNVSLKHGTASIADKSGGLGGSVNINNSYNSVDKCIVKCLFGVGSYNSYDGFLRISGNVKKITSKTRIYYNYSKNDYTFINRGIGNIDPETGEITNPLDTNKNANYQKYGVLQELYYRPGEKNIISVKWWGQMADRTIPKATSYEGPDNSNLNNQVDIDNRVVADWNRYNKKSKLQVRSGFAWKQLDYTLKNSVPGVGIIPAVYSESSQRSSYNNITYTDTHLKTVSLKLRIDADFHRVSSKDSVSKTGYSKQRSELSALFAISKSIKKRLNINLMLRQDYIDSQLNPFIPFLGFDFRLIKEKELILKGNIARNYHQPTLNDLYWQPGGNPDLLPERGVGGEVGVEYLYSSKRFTLSYEVTAYYNNIDNWIIWIPSFKGYWEPRNIKNVISKGMEMSINTSGALHPFKYRITATYAYTNSKNYGDPLVWGDASYGKQLVYIPLNSGNFMANISYSNFFITWQHNSYSERYTTSSNDVTRRDWLYPYFMNDLSIGKRVNLNKATLFAELKIYNIFNETYHSVLYRPMPRRNFIFLISINI